MELLVRKKIHRIETASAHLWMKNKKESANNALQSIENALLKELEKKLVEELLQKMEVESSFSLPRRISQKEVKKI